MALPFFLSSSRLRFGLRMRNKRGDMRYDMRYDMHGDVRHYPSDSIRDFSYFRISSRYLFDAYCIDNRLRAVPFHKTVFKPLT
jgi:hypothetical protein